MEGLPLSSNIWLHVPQVWRNGIGGLCIFHPPPHVVLFVLITLMIFSYDTYCCAVFSSLLFQSLLGPNVLLTTLFSKALNLVLLLG
jgi:hypothetical protein